MIRLNGRVKGAIFISLLFSASIYFFSTKTSKVMMNSEAYKVAVEQLRDNKNIPSEIGEVKKIENNVGGSLSSSEAKFYMRVFGSKDTAVVTIGLTKEKEIWEVKNIDW